MADHNTSTLIVSGGSSTPTLTGPTSEAVEGEEPVERFENPFDAIAYLFMVMREALDQKRDNATPPRYVRIARGGTAVAPLGGSDENWASYVRALAEKGVTGYSFAMAKLVDYTLLAREMLVATDSLVALAEVALKFLGTISDQDFLDAWRRSLTPPELEEEDPEGKKPQIVDVTTVNEQMAHDWARKAEQYLSYIPLPEDLDRIGHELYRMARVVYVDGGATPNLADTGRLRIIAWAFDVAWHVDYPAAAESQQLVHLGRRSPKPARPAPPEEVLFDPESSGIALFEVEPDDQDLKEAFSLLKTLGYLQSTDHAWGGDHATYALRWFQKVNDLPLTGELDNDTLNRLFNLDHRRKNIRRALRADESQQPDEGEDGGYLDLVNADADGFDESQLITRATADESTPPTGDYGYYFVDKTRTGAPFEGAWQTGNPAGFGGMKAPLKDFFGLESRRMLTRRKKSDPLYDGGPFSEGEAAEGRYFFGARITMPWEAGRSGKPAANALYDTGIGGQFARMHQAVRVPRHRVEGIKDGYELVLRASALCRSTYTDRTRRFTPDPKDALWLGMPDQGRILLDAWMGDEEDLTRIEGVGDNAKSWKGKWSPTAFAAAAIVTHRDIHQRNPWYLRTSRAIRIDKDVATGTYRIGGTEIAATDIERLWVRVYLDAKGRSGWDIDSYFDDVRLRWDHVKSPDK